MNAMDSVLELTRTNSPLHRPTRVMIVEDDKIVATLLHDMLTRLGYAVAAAVATGEQALALVPQLLPDIILMDIQLQAGLDGIETARRIPAALQIPVIYITAYSDDATINRASTTHPSGFLIKPIQERLLHANIVAAQARSQARSQARPQASVNPCLRKGPSQSSESPKSRKEA